MFALLIESCLLSQVAVGPKSWKELRTVNGIVYKTFHEAAEKKGLMNCEDELIRTLGDAALRDSPYKLRGMFVQILISGNPKNPRILWDLFEEALIDPKYTRMNTSESEERRARRREKGKNLALFHISRLLEAHERSTDDFKLPARDMSGISQIDRDEAEDDLPTPPVFDKFEEANRLEKALTEEQKAVYQTILHAVKHPDWTNVFFLEASGGAGKTFLYR